MGNWWRGLPAVVQAAIVAAILGGAFGVVAACIGILPDLFGLSDPPDPPPLHTISETRSTPLLVDGLRLGSPDYCFSKGRLSFDQREYARAIEYYTLTIAKRPDFAEAYYERARTYIQLQDAEESMQDVTEFLRLMPHDCRGYRMRGYLHYGFLKDDVGAADDYAKVVELCPDADAYEFRGDVYFYQGRYQEAIADYTETLKLDPERLGALRRRGYSYQQVGEGDLAITDYNRALELALVDELTGRGLGGVSAH